MMNHDYVTDAQSADYYSTKLDEAREENARLRRLLERVAKHLNEVAASGLLSDIENELRDG